MNITIIGTGYVGLVTGACFAAVGHKVICVDIDGAKIRSLQQGVIPIYEPGLEELVKEGIASGGLVFTTELVASDLIFVCIGTLTLEDGSVDLSQLWTVLDTIKSQANSPKIIVIKSTVPPGTNAEAHKRLSNHVIVSNPEFLREGQAIHDFFEADRVVIGTTNRVAQLTLEELYSFSPQKTSILIMGPEDAELTKYAANSFLAMKISFINEIANLCEAMGINIDNVQKGMGEDERIGYEFLKPGLGYGGSCFPKDVDALREIAKKTMGGSSLLDAIHSVNKDRAYQLSCTIAIAIGGDYNFNGKTIAVLGAAFKPGTDDVRESQALNLIDLLLGAMGKPLIRVYDPQAMDNMRAEFIDWPNLYFAQDAQDAAKGADVLVLATEWPEFNRLSWDDIKSVMQTPIVVDGRNMFNAECLRKRGFTYYGVGR